MRAPVVRALERQQGGADDPAGPDMAEQSVPASDTGSLEGDLLANARLVRETLTDPRMGPVFQAVIAAAACDEECATALNGFCATRIREWAPCVERAAAVAVAAARAGLFTRN
ncbi:TetR/AcrR family transcriptional regulator C-terminal ligand-binding domain-containing protein [Streptomyces sp. ISL-99]|uniref:TetR/AcrR family transcriptional regulator C-terminal ligand-binding domain-containing protein n=1 Tax=Streptomyces sp. ISL-99 TaxID=2819193 RepID=UPI0027E3E1EB|nr:TetR/AcrR family transcriptional regulator C-terminal ligand-binding domain-containing protein [Streptomyces sp. ISL-99]